jgi:hypothetical protein
VANNKPEIGMMDQLASVGVEFDPKCLGVLFEGTKNYYESLKDKKGGIPWASPDMYNNNSPLRPWALAAISKASSPFYLFAGTDTRSPGRYRQVDPHTERAKKEFLCNTNERIHSSVRVRRAWKGLGLNDKAVWEPASLKGWEPKRVKTEFEDPVPKNPSWAAELEGSDDLIEAFHNDRYVWECTAKTGAHIDPKARIMVEEPLGPYERHLLHLSAGKGTPLVYQIAEPPASA